MQPGNVTVSLSRTAFQETNVGLARIHSQFGPQEITAKPCQKDGDVFLTIRSGERMIALSLTFDECEKIEERFTEIRNKVRKD